MITPAQEKWIAHLNDHDQVVIVPFDPAADQIFAAVRQKIQSVLGPEIEVEHHGATSLGISGQDEIDIYIPVPEERFNPLLEALISHFGQPRSHYPLDRARFHLKEGSKRVDFFLINKSCESWINGRKFEDYLKSHPEALERYRKLKESGAGLSTREYYRRKILFINEILELVEQAVSQP